MSIEERLEEAIEYYRHRYPMTFLTDPEDADYQQWNEDHYDRP